MITPEQGKICGFAEDRISLLPAGWLSPRGTNFCFHFALAYGSLQFGRELSSPTVRRAGRPKDKTELSLLGTPAARQLLHGAGSCREGACSNFPSGTRSAILAVSMIQNPSLVVSVYAVGLEARLMRQSSECAKIRRRAFGGSKMRIVKVIPLLLLVATASVTAQQEVHPIRNFIRINDQFCTSAIQS